MPDKNVEAVLSIFDQINSIPRKSHNLQKIHQWLMEWGKNHNFETLSDEALNILIRIPATAGYEDKPIVVLQGHMDMVCEKRPDVEHDFSSDPIISWRDGDWLKAEGTSLGADNGIALALFMDLATDTSAEHPELEILITSDEETGLIGAQKLKPGFLKGSMLLNLDSEEEGVFTIGCAGGMDTNLFLPVHREKITNGYTVRQIEIGGLEGGHSGLEIHSGKASANVLIVRTVREILDKIPETRIASLSGGSAHNAIAREARCSIGIPTGQLSLLESILSDLEKILKTENALMEKNLFVRLTSSAVAEEGSSEGFISAEEGEKLIDTLRLIPHGVRGMSTEIEDAVETSMNFAVLQSKANETKVLTNMRSAVKSRSSNLSSVLCSLARLYGGRYESGNHYPAWTPSRDSALLKKASAVWEKISGSKPEVEVTHAGLECGAISAHYPDMDMISFGPTILQPHSPDERMLIPSLGRIRIFLRELLAHL